MQDLELRMLIRDRPGINIFAEIARYFARKAVESSERVAVMDSDSRTGIPRREGIDRRVLPEEEA
jgi:hypothetical protein